MQRLPSGRTFLARKILMKAAEQAWLEDKRKIWVKCTDEQEVKQIRNACYWYQKKWAAEVQEDAILEGKDPELTLNGALMTATWPSASLSYKFVAGEHWLVIEFKRIASDPSWDDMLSSRMTSTAPEEPKLDQGDIINLLDEEYRK